MKNTSFFWILSKDNTAPFIVVALTYFAVLFSPFLYFLYLQGHPHSSEIPSIDWREDSESPQFVQITRIALFSAVLAFGAIGAAVSLITRVRSNK